MEAVLLVYGGGAFEVSQWCGIMSYAKLFGSPGSTLTEKERPKREPFQKFSMAQGEPRPKRGFGNSFQPAIDAPRLVPHKLRHCPKRKDRRLILGPVILYLLPPGARQIWRCGIHWRYRDCSHFTLNYGKNEERGQQNLLDYGINSTPAWILKQISTLKLLN
ncbi:hypothetical protein RJ640_029671 [Escallonia rubra]|uniref:Uncharacterized protein n=1 Tax=Escallonia rubra TaxID=112253 RepID=A0AA88R9T3_9ASTE|nr:hypothetical protein RJ640_029671 [Escallonia rubra]